MDFKAGDKVISADGKDVGRVERVVIDPRTREVIDIIVKKGFLLGQDKVVSIGMIDGTYPDGVHLRPLPENMQLKDLPDYIETHYVINNEKGLQKAMDSGNQPISLFPYPPAAIPGGVNSPGEYFTNEPVQGAGYGDPYVKETERNVPEESIEIKEGSKVFSLDDRLIGNVEHILTEPEVDQVTHIVVSKGIINKSRWMIPSSWLEEISDEAIRLAVDEEVIKTLPMYREEK